MKKSFALILAVLCAAALFGRGLQDAASPAPPGAWTPLGPYGGDIVGLARNPKSPNELYAVSSSYPCQVFRSVNSGKSWASQAVLNAYVYDLAVNPKTAGTIYLLTDSAVQVSKDKGKTYSRLSLPSYFQAYDGGIAVHPSNPKIIIVCGYYTYDTAAWKSEMAVARTTNGGATWTLKSLSRSTDYGYGQGVAIAASNPNYIYVCGYENKDNVRSPRVFVSKNGGGSWSSVGGSSVFSRSTGCFAVHVDPRDPKKAWVGHTTGIGRTANAGASWQAQTDNQIDYVSALAADASNPNILYGGGRYKAVYANLKSTDGGATWKAVTQGVYGEPRRILASGPDIHQATRAGIFRSKNGGGAWAPSHAGIRAATIDVIAVAPSSPATIYAGIYGYALVKTVNGGAAWSRCAEFYGSQLVASVIVHPTDANTLFVKPSG